MLLRMAANVRPLKRTRKRTVMTVSASNMAVPPFLVLNRARKYEAMSLNEF